MIDNFKILYQKEIIMILIGGDWSLQPTEANSIIQKPYMPYLSGTAICTISTKFGLYQSTAEKSSRKQYFENLLNFTFDKNNTSELLSFLFSLENFDKKLSGLGAKERKLAYDSLVKSAIDEINGCLLFSNQELVKHGEAIVIKPIGAHVQLKVPQLAKSSNEQLQLKAERAYAEIENGHYDSALTKARTLLEETFVSVLASHGVQCEHKGDIGLMLKQVRDNLNMNTNKDLDKRLNSLISGLNTCVVAISDMRNNYSDAHATGPNTYNIKEHHARLAVNAAVTTAEFFLSSNEISRK